MNIEYVLKKLDNAYLGHEEDKQWVLSNVGEVWSAVQELIDRNAEDTLTLTHTEQELEEAYTRAEIAEEKVIDLERLVDELREELYHANNR